MAKYKFFGTATMKGAWFYVTAPDIEAARRRASDGDFDDFDIGNAEIVDSEINIGTAEPCG